MRTEVEQQVELYVTWLDGHEPERGADPIGGRDRENGRRIALAVALASLLGVASAILFSARGPATSTNDPTGPPPATSAEDFDRARAVLDESISIVATNPPDFSVFCGLAVGDSSCASAMRAIGPGLPTTPPVVIDERYVPRVELAGGSLSAGWIFTVCGQGPSDQPYVTDFNVIDTPAGLRAMDPFYWSGRLFVDSPSEVGVGEVGGVVEGRPRPSDVSCE